MASPPVPCDLILVLAGSSERHRFGLQLWREGLAPRLLLSIGRFDARRVAAFLPGASQLQDLVRAIPPRERHFFADLVAGGPHFSVAKVFRRGTYPELQALACYLELQPLANITIVSTSIHLRRVRYCCRRIHFFRDREISYVAVPEQISSFQQRGWWKRLDHCSYLAREYAKLFIYAVVYRGGEGKRK